MLKLRESAVSKPKNKSFQISEPYHLFKVDRWWAKLLGSGAKEILELEWEALGQLKWTLIVTYQAVPGNPALNVGHPEYADYSVEDLNALLYEALASFESAYGDFTLLESRVQMWGLKEEVVSGQVTIKDKGLNDIDRLIAVDFVWPEYKLLKRTCAFLAVQMREAEAELKARDASDYFAVRVDRGMLREAFLRSVGYDNDFLFEEVEFLPSEE